MNEPAGRILKNTNVGSEIIPFNRTSVVGNELYYVGEAVASGEITGDGTYTSLCRELFEKEFGIARCLLTPSCTHALEMAALLLDIQPGDEVILPTFTFVSSANAFVLRGAKPVFIDSRPDNLNIDESHIESRITDRTKAIVLVHYAGVGCDMESIMKIAQRRGIPIVEDNAHGLFGTYRGKYLGTFGALATMSFHGTKNISSGEGGALFINDDQMVERAEIIREKGTNRSRFFRGEVDKYTWVDIGSSYLPSELVAAYLYGQLEMRDAIQSKRKMIWDYYFTNLVDWAVTQNVQLPTIPSSCEQTYHMFYMLLPDLQSRQAFISFMKLHGIQTPFHYLPLHLSDMGRKFGGKSGDCPVAENLSDRLVRLPLFYSMTESQRIRVVQTVKNFQLH